MSTFLGYKQRANLVTRFPWFVIRYQRVYDCLTNAMISCQWYVCKYWRVGSEVLRNDQEKWGERDRRWKSLENPNEIGDEEPRFPFSDGLSLQSRTWYKNISVPILLGSFCSVSLTLDNAPFQLMILLTYRHKLLHLNFLFGKLF